jgi:hypothetical protein
VAQLKARIARLEARIGPAVGQWVIVWTTHRDDEPPIERVGPGGVNLSLRVPDGPGDPMERLTDEQRSAIGPHDRVIVVRHIAETPEGRTDE